MLRSSSGHKARVPNVGPLNEKHKNDAPTFMPLDGRTPPGTPPTTMPVRVVAAHDLGFGDPAEEAQKLRVGGGDISKEVDDFLLSLPFGTSRNDAIIEEAVANRIVSTMSAQADLEEKLSGWVSVAGELQDVVLRQSQHIKYLQGQREPAVSYSFPLPHAGTQQELSQLRSVLHTIQHEVVNAEKISESIGTAVPQGAVPGVNSEELQHPLHLEGKRHAAPCHTTMEAHSSALAAMQDEQQRLRKALVDAELELQRVKVSADASRPDPQVLAQIALQQKQLADENQALKDKDNMQIQQLTHLQAQLDSIQNAPTEAATQALREQVEELEYLVDQLQEEHLSAQAHLQGLLNEERSAVEKQRAECHALEIQLADALRSAEAAKHAVADREEAAARVAKQAQQLENELEAAKSALAHQAAISSNLQRLLADKVGKGHVGPASALRRSLPDVSWILDWKQAAPASLQRAASVGVHAVEAWGQDDVGHMVLPATRENSATDLLPCATSPSPSPAQTGAAAHPNVASSLPDVEADKQSAHSPRGQLGQGPGLSGDAGLHHVGAEGLEDEQGWRDRHDLLDAALSDLQVQYQDLQAQILTLQQELGEAREAQALAEANADALNQKLQAVKEITRHELREEWACLTSQAEELRALKAADEDIQQEKESFRIQVLQLQALKTAHEELQAEKESLRGQLAQLQAQDKNDSPMRQMVNEQLSSNHTREAGVAGVQALNKAHDQLPDGTASPVKLLAYLQQQLQGEQQQENGHKPRGSADDGGLADMNGAELGSPDAVVIGAVSPVGRTGFDGIVEELEARHAEEMDALRTEHALVLAEAQSLCEDWQVEYEQLLEPHQQLKAELMNLAEAHAKLEASHEQLMAKLHAHEQAGRREADGLAQERQLEQLTSWVRSCEDLQEDLAAARLRSAGMEAQVAALREENMSLAAQLADSQDAQERAVMTREQSCRTLQSIQANIMALQTSTELASARVDLLVHRHLVMRSATPAVSTISTMDQAQQMKTRGSSPAGGALTLEVLDPSYTDGQHVQVLLQELKMREEAEAGLQMLVEVAQEEVADSKASLRDCQDMLEEMQTFSEERQKEAADAKAGAEAERQRTESLAHELREVTGTLQAAMSQVSHLQDKVHSLETALDQTCHERDALFAEVNQATTTRGEGQATDSSADGQLEATKTALVVAEAKAAYLEQALADARDAVDSRLQHMAAELANEARKRAQAEARVDEFYRVNTLMQAQTVVQVQMQDQLSTQGNVRCMCLCSRALSQEHYETLLCQIHSQETAIRELATKAYSPDTSANIVRQLCDASMFSSQDHSTRFAAEAPSPGAQPFGSQQGLLPSLPPRPPPSPLFPTDRTPLPVRHTPLPIDPRPLPDLAHPAPPEPSPLKDDLPKLGASPTTLCDAPWPAPEQTAHDEVDAQEQSPVVRVRQFWQEVEAASTGATPPSKVVASRQLARARYATQSDTSTGSAPKADVRPRIVVTGQSSKREPSGSGTGQGIRVPLSPIPNPRHGPGSLAAKFNTTTSPPNMDHTNPFLTTSPAHSGGVVPSNVAEERVAAGGPHVKPEGRAYHSSQAGPNTGGGVHNGPGTGTGGVRNFWIGRSPGSAWHGGGAAATPPSTPMSDFQPTGQEALPSLAAPPLSHGQPLQSDGNEARGASAGLRQLHWGRAGGADAEHMPGSDGIDTSEPVARRSGEKQRTSGGPKASIVRSLKFEHANQENMGINSPKRGHQGVEGLSHQGAGAAPGKQSDSRVSLDVQRQGSFSKLRGFLGSFTSKKHPDVPTQVHINGLFNNDEISPVRVESPMLKKVGKARIKERGGRGRPNVSAPRAFKLFRAARPDGHPAA